MKGMKMMLGATGVLAVMTLLMMGSAFAQISISNDCPDKCESGTLYQKGVWNDKLRVCSYGYQEDCKYGCESNIVACKDFPDEPPPDVADYDETLWKMQKQVYDSVKVDIFTGATTYTKGDNATIFAKVTDLGEPITDGFCDVLIFAPNQSQVDGFNLSYVPSSRGIYSAIYPVPDDYGVYIVDMECFKPFNATNESRFFRTVGITDKLLNATTVSTNDTKTLQDLSLGRLCMGERWTETFDDKQNGNISDFRFLQNITDIIGWFADDTGASTSYEIVLNFYKVTDKGTLEIASVLEDVTIGSAIVPVYFNDTGVEMPFDTTSLIQVEICARRLSGANPTDLIFWYNSNYYNSSFMINTLDYDYPLDFVVGGSSEVLVSDLPFETYVEFATLPEPVLESNHDFCIDNNTLGKTLTWELCVAGRCDNVSRNETIICDYGCYGNMTAGQCNPRPVDRVMILILLFIFVIGVIVALALLYERFTRKR